MYWIMGVLLVILSNIFLQRVFLSEQKSAENHHQDFTIVGKAFRSQKHPLSHVPGHKTGGVFHQAYWQNIIH